MSKWKQKYETGRKFKIKWKKRFSWLEQMSDGSENALCTLCCKILQPKLSTISNHSSTADHLRQEEYHMMEVHENTDEHGLLLEDEKDGVFDDARMFGEYVTNQLRYLSSEKSRNKLKSLVRQAVIEVAEQDSYNCSLKAANNPDGQSDDSADDDSSSSSFAEEKNEITDDNNDNYNKETSLEIYTL